MATIYYSVKTSQLLCVALLTSLISIGGMASFSLYTTKQELPVVETDGVGKCVQVINYKNGDAYNCQDVDILLRTYRKSTIGLPIKSDPASGVIVAPPGQINK